MESTAGQTPAIIDWMRHQRWFGDKSRHLETFAIGTFGTVSCGGVPVDLLTVDCEFRDGERSSYFTPLLGAPSHPAHGFRPVVDAFDVAEFLDWLVSGFAEGRVLVHGDRTMSWSAGQRDRGHGEAYGAALLIRSEQSNTSIRYGEHAIAKVFRRLRPGPNPDVELIQYLTEKRSFRHVPAHRGAVTITVDRQGPETTLVSLQRYVANSGDGWTWLLQELGTRSTVQRDHLLPAIALLGMRTAELHCALASPTTDPAFAPEPIGEREVDALVSRLCDELDRTMSGVVVFGSRTHEQLAGTSHNLVRKMSRARSLQGSLSTRVHGDYHLGQVLRTADDFVIIDFEGEPSRPIALRREKASPLKDVAGLLRSLDYAVAMVERTHSTPATSTLREWGGRASAAFLNQYRATLAECDSPMLPGDALAFRTALDLFLIEKALYEIRYELDNRPDWLEIPLSAVETLGGEP